MDDEEGFSRIRGSEGESQEDVVTHEIRKEGDEERTTAVAEDKEGDTVAEDKEGDNRSRGIREGLGEGMVEGGDEEGDSRSRGSCEEGDEGEGEVHEDEEGDNRSYNGFERSNE